jgi:hypothetical protein
LEIEPNNAALQKQLELCLAAEMNAIMEKDKGNEHFREEDYSTAIVVEELDEKEVELQYRGNAHTEIGRTQIRAN